MSEGKAGPPVRGGPGGRSPRGGATSSVGPKNARWYGACGPFSLLEGGEPDALQVMVACVWESLVNRLPGLALDPALHAGLRKAERQARRELAGERFRVNKRPKAQKTLALAAALREGLPMPEAFEKAGVSKAHGYRLLKQKG